jgi:uncharacterized protein YecE (DUF72 family)
LGQTGRAMLRIGASGYSYDDWVGPFYPPGTPKGRFLNFYAERFRTVEINMSFYRIPDARMVASWVSRTPSDFVFVLKANRLMTHERNGPSNAEAFPMFAEALAPLREGGRLGCVLAQFPNSFRPSDENRDYLVVLRERLPDIDLVCELRHAGWATEDTLDLLRELGIGYCCVDEPDLRGLMPRMAVATSSTGYVRFHGRNKAKWYDHDEAYERHDYLYDKDELSEWVEKVRDVADQTENTYVYFNNHYNAQAVANAEMFAELLIEAGLEIDTTPA